MAALTPMVLDFLDYCPPLQRLFLDSLAKITTEKPHFSRSVNHAWRRQIKEDAYQHPDWEIMVRNTQPIDNALEKLKCGQNMSNQ